MFVEQTVWPFSAFITNTLWHERIRSLIKIKNNKLCCPTNLSFKITHRSFIVPWCKGLIFMCVFKCKLGAFSALASVILTTNKTSACKPYQFKLQIPYLQFWVHIRDWKQASDGEGIQFSSLLHYVSNTHKIISKVHRSKVHIVVMPMILSAFEWNNIKCTYLYHGTNLVPFVFLRVVDINFCWIISETQQ